MSFPVALDSLKGIRGFVREAAASAGLDQTSVYNLLLAVDEIATNTITHGYEGTDPPADQDILVHSEQAEDRLIITLEDEGARFDPLEARLPEEEDLSRPLEERAMGGLGIYLAVQGVDEFKYEHVGGRNRNILIVRRPADRPAP